MKVIKLAKGHRALVDDSDYADVSQYRWHISSGYAVGSVMFLGQRQTMSMHRYLMGDPQGLEVDHRDRNRLNNQRRTNLRVCTRAENIRNRRKLSGSSKYRGVCWAKASGKWTASITFNRRAERLGYFVKEVEAARAYDERARELFGEFANLNFPRRVQTGAVRKYGHAKSSRFLGVHYYKMTGHWVAYLKKKGHPLIQKYFTSEVAAARFYNKQALKLWGPLARQNNIKKGSGTASNRGLTTYGKYC